MATELQRNVRISWGLILAPNILCIVGVFTLGFLVGTVNQRYADAQKIPGVGEVLDKAGKSGGPLGSVAQLGTSISEMQTHVNGLQKNLETLKTVQAALGGGK